MPESLKSISFAFLLAISLTLSGCYSTYSVVSQKYNYDNDISFTINKVQEGSAISTGNGYYYPSRGLKFVFLSVTFKNSSDQNKKLDFGNLYLLEPESHTKYKVEFAMMETAINLFGHVDSEIQPNDSKRRRLVFSYPKDEKPTMFSANDVIYNINYGSGNN